MLITLENLMVWNAFTKVKQCFSKINTVMGEWGEVVRNN